MKSLALTFLLIGLVSLVLPVVGSWIVEPIKESIREDTIEKFKANGDFNLEAVKKYANNSSWLLAIIAQIPFVITWIVDYAIWKRHKKLESEDHQK